MSRPSPLVNLSSARPGPEYHALTPRTPHSRAGRAEEAFTEIELDDADPDADADYRTVGQQQAAPLLGRGGWGDGARVRRWEGLTLETVLGRLPMVAGGLLAGALLLLAVLSWTRPAALQRFVGASLAPATESAAASASATPPPAVDTAMHMDAHAITYVNYTRFPLAPTEYAAECRKLNAGFMAHGDYWTPHMGGTMDVPHHDDTTDYHLPEGERTAVCASTITYMLDGHVGLLADLALMAQAAALARERNRTFLVDDTYWNRGKWTDHFQDVRGRQPGPEPGCRAPPPEELVACPRLARHWVVNSRTAKFHFGHAFANHYEDAYGHQINRKKPLFDAAVLSLTETIRPSAHNGELIRKARRELKELLKAPARDNRQAGEENRPYIAVHLRRGDGYAQAWSFHGGYVPIADYVEAIKDTWARLFQHGAASSTESVPAVYIASDSPSAGAELTQLLSPAAVVFSLARSSDPDLQQLASPGDYFQTAFGALAPGRRSEATRGMIVDFALISGAWAWGGDVLPGATVCTFGSSICKLAAVGLGWDRAFGAVDEMGEVDEKGRRWVEIDQRGAIRPVWSAFNLF